MREQLIEVECQVSFCSACLINLIRYKILYITSAMTCDING
jgi:hypothetical protein